MSYDIVMSQYYKCVFVPISEGKFLGLPKNNFFDPSLCLPLLIYTSEGNIDSPQIYLPSVWRHRSCKKFSHLESSAHQDTPWMLNNAIKHWNFMIFGAIFSKCPFFPKEIQNDRQHPDIVSVWSLTTNIRTNHYQQ